MPLRSGNEALTNGQRSACDCPTNASERRAARGGPTQARGGLQGRRGYVARPVRAAQRRLAGRSVARGLAKARLFTGCGERPSAGRESCSNWAGFPSGYCAGLS